MNEENTEPVKIELVVENHNRRIEFEEQKKINQFFQEFFPDREVWIAVHFKDKK